MNTAAVRPPRSGLVRAGLALLVTTLLGPSTALAAGGEPAESPTDYAPGRKLTIRLSLQEAANLATKYNADVNVARQRMFEDLGRYVEARGAFDSSFGFQGVLDLETRALTSQDLEIERAKRRLLRLVAEQYQGLADALNLANRREVMRLSAYESEAASLRRDIDTMGLVDSTVALSGAEGSYSINDSLRAVYEDIAERARRTLRQIGLLPNYDAKTVLDLTVKYTKTCRSGLVVEPSLKLKATQDNYLGKRLSAAWGGKGIKDGFRSNAGVGVTYPLGKGRGRVSTAAFEAAARANLLGSSHSYADAIAQTVLKTSLAYWKLLEAQERAANLSDACKRGGELTAIGETLLAAGQMTAPELAQVRARAFDSLARASGAEQDVLAARLELAKAMGILVSSVQEAPLVSSSWPSVPDSQQIASFRVTQLANYAVSRRPDLQAASSRQAAAKALAEAACADLRTKRDLEFGVSYHGLHEGGSINSIGALCRGYGGALFGYYPGPSFRLAFNMDLPFGNNVAEGKYLQAAASERQSAIQRRDLERVIRGRIAQLVANLSTARNEVVWRERARDHARDELNDEFERFQQGLTSATKMIQAVDDFDGKEMTLTEARLTLANILSQLRFEIGVMLVYGIGKDGRFDLQEITPEGYDFRQTR